MANDNEIGFAEKFALAEDRGTVLDQLIPGTEEHYNYQCLHAEQQGQHQRVGELLSAWIERHGRTARVEEIRNRAMLLGWQRDPTAAREHVRLQLGLNFDHQREAERHSVVHPSVLDPRLHGREALTAQAFGEHPDDVSGFTEHALFWLAARPLTGPQRRALLRGLRSADVPNLVQLILDDLDYRRSDPFGGIDIHHRLTAAQLDELSRRRPALLGVNAFIAARLVRLRPGPDVEWETDATARQAYLDTLWAFAAPLPPAWSSLQAHVLYHRLDHDRRLGVHDRTRLLDYLKLPRRTSYAEPRYLERAENKERIADLGQDWRPLTGLPAVGDDTELVREYLSHFLVNAVDDSAFATFIQGDWLREVFATTKVLAGVGEQEKWGALLDPARYQALKERVDIELAPTNPTCHADADPVALDVHVKNVPTLVIKVFELNPFNYFQVKGRDIDTSIDLDGLVAAEEQTHTFTEPPLRRVLRRFEFPSLQRPGVYVVEMIGNGRSSRALVRKGGLRFVQRPSAAGHVFTLLDEEGRRVTDGSVWLGGRDYTPADNAEGRIRVPFSTTPGTTTCLLRRGNAMTVASFEHRAESYAFSAGIHVDRESLIGGRQAQVLIRAGLTVAGAPTSVGLVEEASLLIESIDRHGALASREIPGLTLADDAEAAVTFQVPEDLAHLTFTVRGKVKSLTEARRVDVADGGGFDLNGIDKTGATADLHLSRTDGGYVVYLLGKTGEPRPAAPINIILRHRDFQRRVEFTLQTDERGRIELGPLDEIDELQAQALGNTAAAVNERWDLSASRDRCRRPRRIHGGAGEVLRVPFFADRATPDQVALLEMTGEGYTLRDAIEHVTAVGGFLELRGLTAGDYQLQLKDEVALIEVRVTAAQAQPLDGWLVSRRRHLETRHAAPLHLASVTIDAEAITVRLAQASSRARVHVVATRFVPARSAFDDLGSGAAAEPAVVVVGRPRSSYLSGRDIGDEYRYILDRRFARKLAGCLLERPSLLLNPWAVRSTDTGVQEAAKGGGYGASPSAGASAYDMASPAPQAQAATGGAGFANLDFLAAPSVVLANLRPDERGEVVIPRAALGSACQVRVVAVDGPATVVREVTLPEVTAPHRDLRLDDALDSEQHFTERKEVTPLRTGQSFTVADLTTAKLQTYDTLARAFGLLRTLSGEARLDRFAFVLGWPTLDEKEKLEKYSELACHELALFIARKDPDLFARAIRPYLASKRARTFLDRYLLDEDLAPYLEPWAYNQLNAAERALLAGRVLAEKGPTARHLADLCDLQPPDAEAEERLFRSALQGSALETEDTFGADEARKVSKEEKKKKAKPMMPMPAPITMAGPSPGAPAPRPPAKSSRRAEAPRERAVVVNEELNSTSGEMELDLDAREDVQRVLFQTLEQTQEWAETHYYQVPLGQQGPELIRANAFWRDLARHDGSGPFLSPHLALAASSFAEAMLALAVLDLPFVAGKAAVRFEGPRMTIEPATPALLFHRQIGAAREPRPDGGGASRVPILVGQNYLRDDDRQSYEGAEPIDKYVTELLVHTVYVCRVALTNPTSTRRKLDALLQIPRGSIPVKDGFVTRSLHVRLEPYATQSIEYAFYFPAPGEFPHFPVHAAHNEELVCAAPPATLRVLTAPSQIDTGSWAWLSQNGSDEEVLAYLERENIDRLDLDGVAWRMRGRAFYDRILPLLARRHVYSRTLFAYSLLHGDLPTLRQYLRHEPEFLRRAGLLLDCEAAVVDPFAQRWYEHLEYAPLVNARAHALGAGGRKILNRRFAAQYQQYLALLAYRARLTDDDWLAIAYYMLLQDRADEGLAALRRADPGRVVATLQRDYLEVHAAFLEERTDDAARIAGAHREHPVPRWRNRFANALAQLDEIRGGAAQVVDAESRVQRQAQLASREPALDLAVENRVVTISHQNLSECRVSYYRMDVEVLFSRQPFVLGNVDQFSFIAPNRSGVVALAAGAATTPIPLPAELAGANLVVEVAAAGLRRSVAYFAHDLAVQVIEGYGQLRVAERAGGRPVPRAYVKAYARRRGGEVRFFKDGYTDLRGRFDYASLSTNDLDHVERFALLVMSDQHGAVIRESPPPQR